MTFTFYELSFEKFLVSRPLLWMQEKLKFSWTNIIVLSLRIKEKAD